MSEFSEKQVEGLKSIFRLRKLFIWGIIITFLIQTIITAIFPEQQWVELASSIATVLIDIMFILWLACFGAPLLEKYSNFLVENGIKDKEK